MAHQGTSGASFALSRSVRDVLLGADPAVTLTQRAQRVLAELRDDQRGYGSSRPARYQPRPG